MRASSGQHIPFRVRRSARASRVKVTVHVDAEVEVVLPLGVPERAAAAAVNELKPWIERRRREMICAIEQVRGRGGTVPYLGGTLQLVPEAMMTVARRQGDNLLVPEGDPRPAIERFYRRQARTEIAPRLDAAARSAATAYSALTIRGQRTRWASCSSSGAMSFNWRLLLAPENVLEYVIWHEVCHLTVRNHSPEFWALLERYWPTWRTERDWLRRHGATLVL